MHSNNLTVNKKFIIVRKPKPYPAKLHYDGNASLDPTPIYIFLGPSLPMRSQLKNHRHHAKITKITEISYMKGS